jgi:hypothetical protein
MRAQSTSASGVVTTATSRFDLPDGTSFTSQSPLHVAAMTTTTKRFVLGSPSIPQNLPKPPLPTDMDTSAFCEEHDVDTW